MTSLSERMTASAGDLQTVTRRWRGLITTTILAPAFSRSKIFPLDIRAGIAGPGAG
jgi:hypothetical protein